MLASVPCYCFTRRKLLFLHACLHLPARLPAPSLYTPAPVSMIGYTTYAFRHWGSSFFIRATETSTSRYRITALPYQFFLLSPSKNTLLHSTNRVPVRWRACFSRKSKKMYQMSVHWSQNPRLINTYAEKISTLTYFYPPRLVYLEMRHIFAAHLPEVVLWPINTTWRKMLLILMQHKRMKKF